MTQDQKIQMPGSFGGLMRYDEEYGSRFKITPGQVIGFVIFVVLFVIFLKLFWPVAVTG